MKNVRMIALKKWLLLSLTFVAALAVQAQLKTVTGKVTDAKTKEALAGVTLKVKNTLRMASTDENGNFSISIDDANAIITFTYVNYLSKDVNAAGKTTLDVTLDLAESTLTDVVVIGYGTVKKSDVTGAVVSLKAKDLNPGANMNVEQALLGRASGVQVYQKSGEPGSAMSVKIRGASSITAGNDPLYVIDGMPVNNIAPVSGLGAGFVGAPNPRNPLNSLNPSDIESIEILKDASATAIYGSRGSNGVVMITTKRGSSGMLKINYNASYGVQKVANSLDMLTGDQYKEVLNAIIDAGGGSAGERVTNESANVDWQKQLYQTANVHSHDLSLSGGKDNTKFYASLGYFNQEGVLLNSGVKRYTARLNLENSVAKKYAFNMSVNTSYIRDQFNSVGIGVNENASSLYSAINYDPTYPVFAADGKYYPSPFLTPALDHPLAMINGHRANMDGFRTFGTISGEYFLMPSLSVKVKGAGDVNISQRNTWIDPSTIAGSGTGGIASIATGNVNYYMAEATMNYSNSWGKDHSLNAVMGLTYDHFASNSFNGNGRGYALPDLEYNAIGSGNSALNVIGSGRASTKIVSYLGRANYTFKDRYLFTVSFRADGSSRFGANNRFGYFPSGAFAWKMHQEEFMEGFDFIDELKPRISYGVIGNQNIGNYLYFTTFGKGGEAIFNGVRNPSIAPTRSANPDLKWEAAHQADVGLDFSLFRRRVTGSIEYYMRKTSDLLLALPTPLSTGFGSQTRNIGSMRNSGIDLHLAGDVIRNQQLTWNLGVVLSTVKNEVRSLGPLDQIITGAAGDVGSVSIIRPGESLGSYYGWQVLGVWQKGDDFSQAPTGVKPGDMKYLDVNGDKMINADDRVVLGKSIPDYTYGITNSVDYKGFNLSIFIEGSQGGKLLNNAAIESYFPTAFRRNKLAEPYLNRWTETNPTNDYPSFVNPSSQGQQRVNSKTVEDASYIRLQSVRLSYNVPVKTKFIRSLQAYVTGQNLVTITNYTGSDPAANSLGEDILKIDYSSYPMTRTIQFGINVQF
ncbi:MAG: TonB-dependent receptor [Candidatus Pseudobacter hemicellulosilyticus]|uniref:TonB-dependent receptor n=1 Tax=Candidatus Pseudobacter hemicellulosilyticus TaxID=3121375 RepID=A0AAJ6BIM4_9BACT|nr:MAG: TonB-dependent receptor [Pseudobacter sp.]